MPAEKTLPARYYTDPALFGREQERFFARLWVAAGRAEEITAAGDYIVREVAGESVIVTRQAGGDLAAFYNVCRHRGTRICTEAAGHFHDRIQCPYHAWTYDLGGRLTAAPHMDDAAGFRKEEHGLVRVAADAWDGHLFVNLSPDPAPLAQQIGDLAAKFASWGMQDLRRACRVTYDVKANWKLLILNYSECLHCPVIHPGLQRLSHYMTGANEPPTETWLGGAMSLREGVFTMSRDGRQARLPLPGLNESERRHVYYYALLPNLLLSLHPDYVMTHTLWPRACDLTQVVCEWLFHPRDHANPAFDPGDVIDFWDETNRQDWHVSELAQLGISSRSYEPGFYSPREHLLWEFDQLVRRTLEDGGGDPPRAERLRS